jgi:hypothetical protein
MSNNMGDKDEEEMRFHQDIYIGNGNGKRIGVSLLTKHVIMKED